MTIRCVLVAALAGGAAAAQSREPIPQDAAAAILAAFEKYDVVGMSAAHGNKQLDDFILTLVRNPALPGKVSDRFEGATRRGSLALPLAAAPQNESRSRHRDQAKQGESRPGDAGGARRVARRRQDDGGRRRGRGRHDHGPGVVDRRRDRGVADRDLDIGCHGRPRWGSRFVERDDGGGGQLGQ